MAEKTTKNRIEKIPPQAMDVEKALIGAMLIEKEAIAKAVDIVTPPDFYSEVHKHIFSNICDLYNENKSVDYTTLSERLNKNAIFAEIGGALYLSTLVDSVQTAVNAEQYAQIIRDKSILRQIIAAGSAMTGEAFNEVAAPDEILEKYQSTLLNISQTNTSTGFERIGTIAGDTLDLLERLHSNKTEIPGLHTGFPDIDSLTAGLQPGELIIIGARATMGKTTFALNIAENIAISNRDKIPLKPVAIFSLEMVKEELIRRFLASISKVNAQNLKKGIFNKKQDWTRITSAMSLIAQAPLYVDDTSALNIMDIRSRARKLALELKNSGTPLSLLIVDHMHLMSGTGRYDSRVLELGEISAGLKALARDLRIPVIAVAQLNRSPEKGDRKGNIPILSDIRESGAIEQDADVVMLIHRDWYYNKTDMDKEKKATIIVAKQRNGPVGDVILEFDGEHSRFNSASDRKNIPADIKAGS
ncbi:MAG: replicative DNA helicase [Elusimicrobiota bacterium]|jgi:replicative DNA helicase|nr:replicative DNA helicase [Elusimicrobiota bacterium]